MVVNKEEIKELIEGLERACDLFEKLQEKEAVIEAEEIVKEVSNGISNKGN